MVSLVVDSYARKPPGETLMAVDLKNRLDAAAETWSDEHPEFSPYVREAVRRAISAI